MAFPLPVIPDDHEDDELNDDGWCETDYGEDDEDYEGGLYWRRQRRH